MSGLGAKSQEKGSPKGNSQSSRQGATRFIHIDHHTNTCHHDQIAIMNDEVKLVVSEMQVHWQWARECLCYQGKRNHLLQTHAQAWEVEDSGHMRISDQRVK